jgi:hypothetical protein
VEKMKNLVVLFVITLLATLAVSMPQNGVELQILTNSIAEESPQEQSRVSRGIDDVESFAVPNLGFSQNQSEIDFVTRLKILNLVLYYVVSFQDGASAVWSFLKSLFSVFQQTFGLVLMG